jgi:D-alanyl-D-alanine carboxypeptidase
MSKDSGRNPRPRHRTVLAVAAISTSLAFTSLAFTSLAFSGLAFASLAFASPAAAHTRHHRLIVPAAPPGAPANAGFGPTAPGVSAILIDATSGQVLSEQGADTPRYPASLTKLMVLDLTFQALRENRLSLDTPVPISWHAAAVQPVKLGLQPGDSLTVEQAILSMTTMSANDAATALGELLGGGSEQRCAEMMTLRAQNLGMAQTHFDNASGLPNPNQVTTARDLAILARDIVVSDPQFQSFFEQTQFDLNGRIIHSNNQMLKLYPGTTGLKTGYTTLAKHNLITSAVRGGRTLIGVVLHEPSWGTTYAQMTAMLDQGFGTPTAADIAYLSAQSQFNQQMNAPSAPQPNAALASIIPQGSDASPSTPPYPSQTTLAPAPTPIITHKPAIARPPIYATPYLADWTAQFGSFTKLEKARHQAIEAAHIGGAGIPRVARQERHGHVLYTAQLAGLTQSAAHQTCWAMAARRTSCTIIPPHLAGLGTFGG